MSKFYIYSHSSVPWQQKILADFISSISLGQNFKCLDAGCGIGNNLETISKFSNDIVAFDISELAIEYAQKRFPQVSVKFLKGNIEKLPFPDSCFDLVICTEVLEHVENLDIAIQELVRVLKKDNGHIILSSPNYFNLAGLVKKVMDYFLKKEGWDVWGTHSGKDKEKFMTSFKLKRLLVKNKITPLQERGGDFLNSWFLFLPFVFRNFKYTDSHPFLKLGEFKFFKKIGMNYFILGRINLLR